MHTSPYRPHAFGHSHMPHRRQCYRNCAQYVKPRLGGNSELLPPTRSILIPTPWSRSALNLYLASEILDYDAGKAWLFPRFLPSFPPRSRVRGERRASSVHLLMPRLQEATRQPPKSSLIYWYTARVCLVTQELHSQGGLPSSTHSRPSPATELQDVRFAFAFASSGAAVSNRRHTSDR